MSKVTASFKAVLVLSVLVGTSAHAQFGGGRGPVTKEGFAAHRARDRALGVAQQQANVANEAFYAQRDLIAARQRAGKHVSRVERDELARREADLNVHRRNYGAIRDAGITPYLPPRAAPVSEPSNHYSTSVVGDTQAREMFRVGLGAPAAGPITIDRSPPRPNYYGVPNLVDRDTVKKMVLASSSLDGDLLEHIFPGKKYKASGGLILTGYSDRLGYLGNELASLIDNPTSLEQFKKRNASWLPRFYHAIAVQQLMRDKVPAMQAATRKKANARPDRSHEQMLADSREDMVKHRATKLALLKELSQAESSDENAEKKVRLAVGRWFKGIGASPKNGAGIIGAAGVIATVAAGNGMAAGEAESATVAADDANPAIFSREEFRTHRTSN